MTAVARALRWLQQARRREMVIGIATALPLTLAGALLLWHFVGIVAAALGVAAAMLVMLFGIRQRLQRIDIAWLQRRLDDVPSLENSADLLFRNDISEQSLAALQQQRVQQRLLDLAEPDFRRPWPRTRLLGGLFLALTVIVGVQFWPTPRASSASMVLVGLMPAAKDSPHKLLAAELRIQAPAYTGVPVRTVSGLSAKFPEGSQIAWQLRFSAQPKQVQLQFFNGHFLVMQYRENSWRANAVFARSEVYRIVVNGKPLPMSWQRLDVILDQPPQWRVSLPERSLSLVAPGQRLWLLQAEAEDDYGLADAVLEIQLVQGSGENIQFKNSRRPLSGHGTATHRRYDTRLDLVALGMQAGDDLIVRFHITDRRLPTPNTAVSASYILRWPVQEAYQASGIEGMLKKVMPAYFRSQRQIIIDTEKLLAEKNKLNAQQFAIRSDVIGVDQRILRLRYGQFLGEESEVAESPGQNDAHADAASHAAGKSSTVSDREILAEYGHTHDIPEAATLLDAETKALLRAALNEMWQAELHLRQAAPKRALPYEYRALALIKKVQQADRIYLARVGTELPPIDESRRLQADRSGLSHRDDALRAAERDDAPLREFWHSLDAPEPPDTNALRHWLGDHGDRLSDPLGLKVALVEMESQPDCWHCREAVKALLWPALTKPPSVPRARRPPPRDAAYQHALRVESQP